MFEIVPDNELPYSVQGDTDVANHYMRIKQCVYDGAFNENGRDRYSIMHEISHYLLMSVYGFGFQRNLTNCTVKAYQDPEWQADCLAGELLIPYNLMKGKQPDTIMVECKVSQAAALTQSRFL